MKYTPDFTIKLADGTEIPLLFTSWMYRQLCLSKGIELDELITSTTTKVMPTTDVPEIIRWAANTYTKYTEGRADYTEMHAYEWIDQMGGFNSPEFGSLFAAIIMPYASKLLNIPQEQLQATMVKAEDVKPEKKSRERSSSRGSGSTKPQHEPA